jgi:hypothetical protein
MRVFSVYLELPRIDVACLNLVIETVTGQPSDIALDPQVLSRISFSDCAFAILPDRSVEECLAALIAAVQNRMSAQAVKRHQSMTLPDTEFSMTCRAHRRRAPAPIHSL